jgi:hypothetical protein
MSTSETLLEDASAALRDHDVVRFFGVMYVVGKAVTAGTTTWSEHAAWAREHASAVIAARPAFGTWSTENGHLFYDPTGGLEEVEKAVRRRSELAFARDLFAGTPADEVLAELVSEEYEHDLHEEADRLDVFRPPTLPATHRWWKPPSGG